MLWTTCSECTRSQGQWQAPGHVSPLYEDSTTLNTAVCGVFLCPMYIKGKFSQCSSGFQRTSGWLSERFKQPALNYSESYKGHTTFKCLVLGEELVFTQQHKDSEGFWHFHHSWKKGGGHLHLITEQLSSAFTEYSPKFDERVSFAIQAFPCSWSKNYIQKARKINSKINIPFYVFHLHSQVYRIGMYYSWTISGIWVSDTLLNDIQKNKESYFMNIKIGGEKIRQQYIGKWICLKLA